MVMDIELLVNTIIWSASVIYSMICLASKSQELKPYLDQSDFTNGWFFGYERDSSDLEWAAFKTLAFNNLLLITVYIVLSQLLLGLKLSRKSRMVFFILSGSIFISTVLNIKSFLFLTTIIITHLTVLLCQQPLSHYLLFVGTVYNHRSQFIKDYVFADEIITPSQVILFEVSVTWTSAKCLSFSIDCLRRKDHEQPVYSMLVDTLDAFAFCLYPPTLFTGPIHKFSSFQMDTRGDLVTGHSANRHVKFLIQIARFIFWAVTFDLMLHFLYANAIQFYPELVSDQTPLGNHRFDGWSFVGLGYTLCCLFYMKYLSLFGIPGVIAAYEGITLPPPPRCVTRNHSSTMLWRHFDRGLYEWLTEYFYKPLLVILSDDIEPTGEKRPNRNISKKMIAGALSFVIVCFWHNLEKAAIIWCSINFITVCMELLINSVINLWQARIGIEEFNHTCENYKIPANGELVKGNASRTLLRIKSSFSAPLFALMIISNIYFLANYELGNAFIRRIFCSFFIPSLYDSSPSLIPFLPTMIVMYSGSYFSLNLLREEKQKPKQN